MSNDNIPEYVKQHMAQFGMDLSNQTNVPLNPENLPHVDLVPEHIKAQIRANKAKTESGASPTSTPTPAAPITQNFTTSLDPVAVPTKAAPAQSVNSEMTGVSVALPTNFMFYPYKDAYSETFKVKHLGKLTRAHEEGSQYHLLETVTSVMKTPSGENLAQTLIIEDFYAMLYWQRFHSFTKTKYIHRTTCQNHDHIRQVRDGKLKPETLIINHFVQSSEIKVRYLSKEDKAILDSISDSLSASLKDAGWFLSPATMWRSCQAIDHPSFDNNPEFQFLTNLACYCFNRNADLPIDDVVNAIQEWDPDDYALIENYIDKCEEAFGVDESVTVTCKECGASSVSKITVDALSFLRN